MLTQNEVHYRISEFIIQTRQFIFDELNNGGWYIAFLYGSYAYKTPSKSSDLDVLFVVEDYDESQLERAINFVKNMHIEYGMDLDFDIPYEKKIMMKREFVERSCSGVGIRKNGAWKLEPIVKSPEILSSDELLKRFVVGMMAHPHIFVSGDYHSYIKYKECASRNIIKAIASINSLTKVTSKQLTRYFCEYQEITGENYIGFCDSEEYKAYLLEYIERILVTMNCPRSTTANGVEYELSSDVCHSPENAYVRF